MIQLTFLAQTGSRATNISANKKRLWWSLPIFTGALFVFVCLNSQCFLMNDRRHKKEKAKKESKESSVEIVVYSFYETESFVHLDPYDYSGNNLTAWLYIRQWYLPRNIFTIKGYFLLLKGILIHYCNTLCNIHSQN